MTAHSTFADPGWRMGLAIGLLLLLWTGLVNFTGLRVLARGWYGKFIYRFGFGICVLWMALWIWAALNNLPIETSG